MAGNKNSGGPRPKAPQNNPANVSPLGGNGQSGDYTGFGYGKNLELNQQRQEGNRAVAATRTSAPTPPPRTSAPTPPPPPMKPIVGITEKSQFPDQSVMDGAPIGDGANSIPGLPTPTVPDNIEFEAAIRAYAPVLSFVASQPGTSKETRATINALLRGSEI